MARTRVDDEEALIPRSDQGEYHRTTKKTKQRCSCCGVKCWFVLFLVLVITTLVVFYFVYPSFVPDHLDNLKSYLCDGSNDPSKVIGPVQSVTCVITVTSLSSEPRSTLAVSHTWARHCSSVLYVYQKQDGVDTASLSEQLTNSQGVSDVNSLEYLQHVRKTPSTSWYLKADDTTFVIARKLQSLLNKSALKTADYICQTSIDTVGTQPYILSQSLVDLIVAEGDGTTEIKDVPKLNGNLSEAILPQLVWEFADISDKNMLQLDNTTMLHGVTPGQMYSFHWMNGDV